MDLRELVYDVCRDYMNDLAPGCISTNLEKRINGALRGRNLSVLCNLSEEHPLEQCSVDEVRVILQVEAFFKKNASFSDPDACKKAAYDSFLRNEKRCRITNRRLGWYYENVGRLDPTMQKYLASMENTCKEVLGDFSRFLESLPDRVVFTGGATATQSRRTSLPYRKMRLNPPAGSKVEPYIKSLAKYFGFDRCNPRPRNVNRVEFVPKNWKTHRTIACEPEGNIPFQLAFDSWVKERLRCCVGIDLRDQSLNQRLARQGSLENCLATVDLEAASDTVAYNAVAWMLPAEWFSYVNDMRSPFYQLEGNISKYHKFSSMGNGCTFGLETLIFAAACKAVGSKEYSVYGDDIVIEATLLTELTSLLAFLGFRINHSKSHSQGPFRESCGKNWYHGVDVTPHYVRSTPRSKADFCHLVNGLASVSTPLGQVWQRLREFVRNRRLPYVPFNDASTTGVYIDVHTAYQRKLLRYRAGITSYRAITVKSAVISVYDTRTYMLQHFRMRGQVRKSSLPWFRFGAQDTERSESSKVPTCVHTFVRKWVCWHPPAAAVPTHIYMWSEYLTT